jgi:dethiobiotin synthetase
VSTLVVTGTGTDVGKTVVTAAIAALAVKAGQCVAVLKPAQTGVSATEAGDVDEIARLAGDITRVELARYPDPVAPRTAARRANMAPVSLDTIIDAIKTLKATHDLVLVEGAGGLLVQFDEQASTVADVARLSGADVVVVAAPGLGTLNITALTAEALQSRGCTCLGLVIGRWPATPDLAALCNLQDLPVMAGAPLLGVLPDNLDLDPSTFTERVSAYLSPPLHGTFDVDAFTTANTPAYPVDPG